MSRSYHILKDIETQKFYTGNVREDFFSKDDSRAYEFDTSDEIEKEIKRDKEIYSSWAHKGRKFEVITRIEIE